MTNNDNKTLIGAIRWDGWGKGNPWQTNLNPQQWHARVPFYGRVISENEVMVEGDSQEVVDQELAYAHAGGLDYWIFLYHHYGDMRESQHNYGLAYYLKSQRKEQLNFCAMTLPIQGEGWNQNIADILEMLKEPTYQSVCDERPLIYLLFWDTYGDPERIWGSLEAGSRAVNELRQKVQEAGHQNPYLVVLTMQVEQGVRYAEAMGLDAISAYANWSYGTYQDLAARNRAHWEKCRRTGKQVAPLVNAGWDPRPRYATEHVRLYGETRDWADQPSPEELAAHLEGAMDYVETHPESCEPRTILIYAWNETDEGSWLLPTLTEGAARLEAIKEMLQKHEAGERKII